MFSQKQQQKAKCKTLIKIPSYYFLEHFNVLWRENWTVAAGKVLKVFEMDVIRKAKTEGYDGQENTKQTQWSFSGALLYSVTVITTIGKIE